MLSGDELGGSFEVDHPFTETTKEILYIFRVLRGETNTGTPRSNQVKRHKQ